jgi:hypothetical protein
MMDYKRLYVSLIIVGIVNQIFGLFESWRECKMIGELLFDIGIILYLSQK